MGKVVIHCHRWCNLRSNGVMISRVLCPRLGGTGKDCSIAKEEGDQAAHREVDINKALRTGSGHTAEGGWGSNNKVDGRNHKCTHWRDWGILGNVHGAGCTGGGGDTWMHRTYNKIDPTQEVTRPGAAAHTKKDKDNEDLRGRPYW